MNNKFASKICILTFIFSIFSTQAAAQKVIVIGTGTQSCGAWVEARNSKNDIQQKLDVQWFAGFVSGHNHNKTEKPIEFDLDMVSLWLDTYCKENPTSYIYHASVAFIDVMISKKNRKY